MHRNYTVDEAARVLNRNKGTIRRWIANGLPALTDQRPHLILGGDLIEFLKKQRRPKVKCGPGEFYCLRCRASRRSALGMAEVVSRATYSVNLRALCEACQAVMHRRVSDRQLHSFSSKLEVCDPQAEEHLGECPPPCVNEHIEQEPETHAKASSGQ
ncbi:helix-turn-helix domain-containing protein [Minwuia sp.]|uniref:helix-turn-helix domain-containing protein n=1 Tax=Minwuia sp. TaxID=2493630 RepID=UPI003A8CE011